MHIPFSLSSNLKICRYKICAVGLRVQYLITHISLTHVLCYPSFYIMFLPTGGFDKRLKENVDYLEQLKVLADIKGVSNQVKFITSCPTAERNALLSDCLCVMYTPKVPQKTLYTSNFFSIWKLITFLLCIIEVFDVFR